MQTYISINLYMLDESNVKNCSIVFSSFKLAVNVNVMYRYFLYLSLNEKYILYDFFLVVVYAYTKIDANCVTFVEFRLLLNNKLYDIFVVHYSDENTNDCQHINTIDSNP